MYSVKEVFYSLQGEGAHAGRPAIFCRFSGCNLWSGREQDRDSAQCTFCDTDFIGTNGQGGGKFTTAKELARHVRSFWPDSDAGKAYVVCTGGEPLLQLDDALVRAFHQQGLEIAIETNGTLPVPDGIDWVCVSPKGSADVIVEQGNELKLVYPQAQSMPEKFSGLAFDHLFLQPMAIPLEANLLHSTTPNLRATIDYCLQHPQWRLSLQTHKLIDIE